MRNVARRCMKAQSEGALKGVLAADLDHAGAAGPEGVAYDAPGRRLRFGTMPAGAGNGPWGQAPVPAAEAHLYARGPRSAPLQADEIGVALETHGVRAGGERA